MRWQGIRGRSRVWPKAARLEKENLPPRAHRAHTEHTQSTKEKHVVVHHLVFCSQGRHQQSQRQAQPQRQQGQCRRQQEAQDSAAISSGRAAPFSFARRRLEGCSEELHVGTGFCETRRGCRQGAVRKEPRDEQANRQNPESEKERQSGSAGIVCRCYCCCHDNDIHTFAFSPSHISSHLISPLSYLISPVLHKSSDPLPKSFLRKRIRSVH